jgi:hypothetical protein
LSKLFNTQSELLDEAERHISQCSVGILSISKERSESLGSGTLVSYGNVQGILTCAHVVSHFSNVDPIGILMFEKRELMSKQATRLYKKDIESQIVAIRGSEYGISGPDLAFFALPSELASSISAKSTFINFSKRRTERVNGLLKADKALSCLQGLIQVWDESDPTYESEKEKIYTHHGLINIGSTLQLPTDENGFDYFDFVVDPSGYQKFPERYWATSGGGVWKFRIVNRDDSLIEVVDENLVGVVYYESRNDKEVLLKCHGPESIYSRLWEALAKKWPRALSL